MLSEGSRMKKTGKGRRSVNMIEIHFCTKQCLMANKYLHKLWL